MSVAIDLFNCFITSVEEAITNLLNSGVLDSCDADWAHDRACVLQSILTERTLTYLGLRNLYATIDKSRGVRFDPECAVNGGRIDLILTEGTEEYAFEFKRWQAGQEKEILGKDYNKLIAFRDRPTCRQGYELIFTVNEDRAMRDVFRGDKRQFYEGEFQKLSSKYSLCELKILEFGNPGNEGAFTICAYLAALKP